MLYIALQFLTVPVMVLSMLVSAKASSWIKNEDTRFGVGMLMSAALVAAYAVAVGIW